MAGHGYMIWPRSYEQDQFTPQQELEMEADQEKTSMTIDEAHEYVEHAHEIESEQRAEYGSGAVSLGLDASEWMPAFDGYRTATDPTFAEAQAIIDSWAKTAWTAMPCPAPRHHDDICRAPANAGLLVTMGRPEPQGSQATTGSQATMDREALWGSVAWRVVPERKDE